MSKEEWKPIPNYEGYYEASTFGRIRNVKRNEIRKLQYRKDDCVWVNLCEDGTADNVPVHKVVALTFIPQPKDYHCVIHINGIKTDNHPDNLKWVYDTCRRKKRKQTVVKQVTLKEQRHNSNSGRGKTPIVASKDGAEYIFLSQSECATTLGLQQPNINACLKGKLKTHKGYSFKYLD
ncbi:NUMOD4 motif protein [Enterococcus phage Phi_Eg_SY1]|nr:NUMOD4 motif protein [Enterococcus phage Phi_Eg_SY1]